MGLPITRLAVLLATVVALAAPAAALAKGEEVIRDCAQDGSLDGDYSQEELDEAYNNMPSDIDEYSNCREVIEKARERGQSDTFGAGSQPIGTAGGGGSNGSGGGSDFGGSGTDEEELKNRQENSAADKAPDARVGDELATGNSAGTIETGEESNGMPAPLIAAIILALLAGLAGLLYLLRDRLPPGLASRLPSFLKG